MPRRRHGIAILLVLLAQAAVAGVRPEAEALDALIQRSGIDRQLTNFEAAMQRGITAAHATQRTLASEDVNRLRSAVASAYSASSLRPVLRIELAKTLTPAEITAALAWLDSPTGRKLTALEAKASAPEAQARLEAASHGGGAPSVTPARARILHELISATQADKMGASLLIETAAGVSEGAALFSQDGPSAITAAARKELEARRSELVAAMHEQSFIAFSLVYAEASDAELSALLAFARSPAGAHYHAASARAFESTLTQAAKRLGGALAAPAAPASN
jgi:hypothetical protein